MDLELSSNSSKGLIDIHPCYKTDASFILMKDISTACVLLYICLALLCTITICGNFLVIISIIYFKQLHTPTNYLILSLAVADLLVGVLVFPLTMEYSVVSCWFHKDLFCKVRGIFDISLCTSSILHLCCISIDRYHAVCQPLTYRTKINNNVIAIMITVSWGLCVLTGIGFIISGLNTETCDETCMINAILANIIGLFLSFYLPVIIMLSIYLKIFLVAQKQARSIQNTKCGATVSKMERKATKTLAVVMGVFLLCWFPFFLCTTVLSLSYAPVPLSMIETLNWLALSNSTLNPFIYAFFYCWFRSALRIILSGKIVQGDFTNSKLF